MPTITQRVKSSSKANRAIRLITAATDSTPAVVRIVVNRKTALYAVTEIENELGNHCGRAFLVREITTSEGAEQYSCIATGNEPCCTCKGFVRWNHCKHADGLRALVLAGRI